MLIVQTIKSEAVHDQFFNSHGLLDVFKVFIVLISCLLLFRNANLC